MIDIREILVRIFSAIFLSMCTGSCMFVFWMVLRKFFADKIRPKVYDLILKIILIAYYVPAGYLLVNIFFDNGYVFDFTGTIINVFYAIALFWLAGAIATVLKFGERTFRIRREKERCFPCKMYVQKIFEDCKRELGIRRSIEVLQGYRIQIPMTAGIFINIVAWASYQRNEDITPYWRTLKSDGELNIKYPEAIELQKRLLEEEGHTIISKGTKNIKYYVKDFEKNLIEL